jgi:hypothetical protein
VYGFVCKPRTATNRAEILRHRNRLSRSSTCYFPFTTTTPSNANSDRAFVDLLEWRDRKGFRFNRRVPDDLVRSIELNCYDVDWQNRSRQIVERNHIVPRNR